MSRETGTHTKAGPFCVMHSSALHLSDATPCLVPGAQHQERGLTCMRCSSSLGISPPTIAMLTSPLATAAQQRRVFSTCRWTSTSGCDFLYRSAHSSRSGMVCSTPTASWARERRRDCSVQRNRVFFSASCAQRCSFTDRPSVTVLTPSAFQSSCTSKKHLQGWRPPLELTHNHARTEVRRIAFGKL